MVQIYSVFYTLANFFLKSNKKIVEALLGLLPILPLNTGGLYR